MLDRRFFLAAGAALVVAGPLFAQHADLEPGPEAATEAPVPRRYLMEDAWGNALTDEDFLGKFVLIYFGYTGCPDVCPTTLSVIADALAGLDEAQAARVAPLFVTVDPDHDTAKLLQEYTAVFDSRIIPLRGPKAYTDHMVAAFNARYERIVPDPAQPERYSIDHTASVALVGPDGQLIKRYPHGTTGAEMAADLKVQIAAVPEQ
ncbi:hypothetical protein LPB142_11905 [Rhodobacter xanthinilyticus]|uniref:Thioredoxin domain-containing protein n=1 Tax=Rhodobacter xanthinilyticus TaxID=1850250 RepID=A0A1D9MDK8_9RHOB|nr:SCO family protein [Rhodobacter xanthinilyticus]AOZ69941.1 hypothetical protein LPB142_11905 [Rhodobacter xanthinilyticus]